MAKKIAPFVKDPDIKRALNDVYNDINKILDSIEVSSYNSIQSSLGKVGDIKAIKDSKDGSYKISGKTKHGWISSPAYLHTGNKGRRVNIPEFNLHNDDKVKYDKGELNIFSPLGSRLKLGSSDDYFKINTGSDGSTRIITKDKDATLGHLTLSPDGDLTLDPQSGLVKFYRGGDTDDYMQLSVGGNGNTTLATFDSDGTAGDITLDADGDIELNADGGDIKFRDNLTSLGSINYDATGVSPASKIMLYNPGNIADYCKISVTAEGATTISTVDANTAVGHLKLNADGDIKLDADSGFVYLQDSGTTYGIFSTTGAVSRLRMYEDGGASGDDFFNIDVGEHGKTVITTIDAAAMAADILMDVDGTIILDTANSNIAKGVQIHDAGTLYANFEAHHSLSTLNIYEAQGASDDDFFSIQVAADAVTTIKTIDAAGEGGHLKFAPDGSFLIKERASAAGDVPEYGQIWIKNSTPNELYFTTDAGDDIQLTSGTGVAGGGGGTQTWSKTVGGYKTNNNSSSFYYMQGYANYHSWTSSDSSPTTLSYINAAKAATWCADKDGTLTNMRIQLRASDTGVTDPLKFYVYKGTVANNTSSTSLTLIATSSTITPILAKAMVVSDDFSSSNDFDEGDSLFIMLKKDSTSANQDIYFQVTISGEYD